MLDALFNGARKCSLWLTWLGGILIVLSAFLVTLEVFLRKAFNVSLGGADEISGYAFGVSTALALSFALFERAHVTIHLIGGLRSGEDAVVVRRGDHCRAELAHLLEAHEHLRTLNTHQLERVATTPTAFFVT